MSLGANEPLIKAVPVADGVKFTLQVAVPRTPPAGAQLPDELKLPAAPVEWKVTVPEGVRAVPAVDVSKTVALQEEAVFTVTGVLQVMDVEVLRRLTVMMKAVVVELPL